MNTLVGYSESRTTSARWKGVYGFSRFRKTMVKKQRSFASRSSSSSRPGLERAVSQADLTGSSADGPDDDVAPALSRSSSGVSACAEAPRFSSIAHTEHRVRSL